MGPKRRSRRVKRVNIHLKFRVGCQRAPKRAQTSSGSVLGGILEGFGRPFWRFLVPIFFTKFKILDFIFSTRLARCCSSFSIKTGYYAKCLICFPFSLCQVWVDLGARFSKNACRFFKTPQRRPKTAPRRPKVLPRQPQDGLRGAQTPPGCPKSLQNGAK